MVVVFTRLCGCRMSCGGKQWAEDQRRRNTISWSTKNDRAHFKYRFLSFQAMNLCMLFIESHAHSVKLKVVCLLCWSMQPGENYDTDALQSNSLSSPPSKSQIGLRWLQMFAASALFWFSPWEEVRRTKSSPSKLGFWSLVQPGLIHVKINPKAKTETQVTSKKDGRGPKIQFKPFNTSYR